MFIFVVADPMKLQLLNTIGQGGYGTVFKAIWQGTFVAVKVLQADPASTCKEADMLK